MFEQIDLDRGNDYLELDIELEKALIPHTLYYVHGGELGFKAPETRTQAVLYESAYHTGMPHVRRHIKEVITTWKKGCLRLNAVIL